jgi:peptidoglycan hydrolase-like protein with peptidoglycan-binding domain
MSGPIAIISLNARGAEVKKLQSTLTGLGLAVPRHEADAQQFGVDTRDVLFAFQKQHGLTPTGALDDATQAALEKAVAHLGSSLAS